MTHIVDPELLFSNDLTHALVAYLIKHYKKVSQVTLGSQERMCPAVRGKRFGDLLYPSIRRN